MNPDEDDFWDDDDPEDDLDVDVCQNCGGYFAWTDDLRATWEERWNPREGEQQPQRCRRCIADETWIERRGDLAR